MSQKEKFHGRPYPDKDFTFTVDGNPNKLTGIECGSPLGILINQGLCVAAERRWLENGARDKDIIRLSKKEARKIARQIKREARRNRNKVHLKSNDNAPETLPTRPIFRINEPYTKLRRREHRIFGQDVRHYGPERARKKRDGY